MTEKLGVNEKEPAFGQKTPTTLGIIGPLLQVFAFATGKLTLCFD